jgi:hypothetical protein
VLFQKQTVNTWGEGGGVKVLRVLTQNDDIDAGKATARVPDRRQEQSLLEFGIWNLGSFDF